MSPEVLRFLILITVLGAVVLGVESFVTFLRTSRGTATAINKRLGMIASGVDRAEIVSTLRRDSGTISGFPGPIVWVLNWAQRIVHGAGLRISPGMLLLAMVGVVAFLCVVVALFASAAGFSLNSGSFIMIAAFAVSIGLLLPVFFLSRMAEKRRKKVMEQFPIALDVFVRGLRAGHPIASALELLTREMTDPIGSEFGLVVDEVTYGADLRQSLQNMADRWQMADMKMFVTCLAVQNETGGNLAEILENLSGVIRERASLLLKVRALSSEGRMTAIILTALPVMSFVGLFLLNPAFYLDVAQDPAFLPGFVGLIMLYLIGFITIRRMVNLEV